jgi:hypothetical protein
MAGRPTIYDDATAAEICRRIMDGESLKGICEDKDMPARSTVHMWLANNEAFMDKYAKAKDTQADTLADEMQYIADNVIADKDAVAKARLQVDTRKWVAAKLKPKKYGDKLDMTSGGEKLQPVLVKFVGDGNTADN